MLVAVHVDLVNVYRILEQNRGWEDEDYFGIESFRNSN